MGKELLALSDSELIESVRSGNRSSYSELVKRYQRPLLRLAVRFVKDIDVAEDIVQESLIKAYEKLNLFEGRSSFKSWLFQIAVNTAKNKLREKKYNTTDIEDVHIAVGAIAEVSLLQVALADQIQREVDSLPQRQRTALILRVYEELSFKEIADIMECPYDTAKANYRHALLKLKESFEQKEELKNWSDSFKGYFGEMVQFAEVD